MTNLSFVVTDADGEPVAAEVGVKLTDRAILDLLPPNSLPVGAKKSIRAV